MFYIGCSDMSGGKREQSKKWNTGDTMPSPDVMARDEKTFREH